MRGILMILLSIEVCGVWCFGWGKGWELLVWLFWCFGAFLPLTGMMFSALFGWIASLLPIWDILI